MSGNEVPAAGARDPPDSASVRSVPSFPPRTHYLPLTLLMLFAATFPEVLSGSTPVPVLITHPIGFLEFLGLYGCGAALVWEALARWKKGWLAAFPLGAAYGIAEEGLGTKVFTDPHQQAVITGIPGAYGNGAGIEWVPAVGIDMFHAVVSMGLPILLVALLFPVLRGKSLVSTRGLIAVGVVFAAVVTLMFFTVDPDPIAPLAPALALVGAVGLLLVIVAWRLPKNFLASMMRSPVPTATPLQFGGVAFGWLLSLLFVVTIGSHLIPWAWVTVLLLLATGATILTFLVTRSGWRENRRQQVGFAGGLAVAFLVWDVFLELTGDFGVLAFTATLLAIVAWLWRNPGGVVQYPGVR